MFIVFPVVGSIKLNDLSKYVKKIGAWKYYSLTKKCFSHQDKDHLFQMLKKQNNRSVECNNCLVLKDTNGVFLKLFLLTINQNLYFFQNLCIPHIKNSLTKENCISPLSYRLTCLHAAFLEQMGKAKLVISRNLLPFNKQSNYRSLSSGTG